MAKYVEKKEKTIKFGVTNEWPDVEADEVDLRKGVAEDDDGSHPLRWEQWGRVVERGNPSSLVLTRLNPKTTKVRAPGPGPMRKKDWAPFAKKRLRNTRIILHTDGARAYKLRVDGVYHDNVVHKKKQVVANGKTTWIKPKFTKVVTHILPDGKKLRVKAGAQVIDRFWRHVRSHLVGRTAFKVGSVQLRRRVRMAQWSHWNRGKDMWLALGEVLKARTA